MNPTNPTSPEDSDIQGPPLLLELDARQNEVLQQLDDLDRRITLMIDELAGKRQAS